jgi:lactate racemase
VREKMKIELPRRLWYDNTTFEIDLPDTWEVDLLTMRGRDRPPLSAVGMRHAIENPIGTPRLSTLAVGKKSAVIMFDDITRPTRIYEIAPIVLDELLIAGMKEDDITFVAAIGNHVAHTAHEFRKKLGPGILERHRVFNHNPYENCVYVGTTSQDTKLSVNREVMEADLKIGIGCVTAHINTGFSGGGKIILPGVSHIDSSAHYHMEVKAQAPETTGLGRFENNILRKDIDEAAALAGLDFKIDAIVNERGETTALFAGGFKETHREAVKLAKDVYSIGMRPPGKNLVIANAFIKANEMFIAATLGWRLLENETGTVVVIADAPEGQVPHYLQRSFGRTHGGRQHPPNRVPPCVRLMVVAPYWDRNFVDWVDAPEKVTRAKDWKEALSILKPEFGPGTKAAVLPEATIVYYQE